MRHCSAMPPVLNLKKKRGGQGGSRWVFLCQSFGGNLVLSVGQKLTPAECPLAKFNLDYPGQRSSTVKSTAAHKLQSPLITCNYSLLLKFEPLRSILHHPKPERVIRTEQTLRLKSDIWNQSQCHFAFHLTRTQHTLKSGSVWFQWSFM